MKKKLKLFVAIATLCLSLAVFSFGVFSALTITYKTNGTVTYNLEDVFVDIETRVYSSSKKFASDDELKAQSQGFESSSFEVLNATTQLDNTYTFNKEQIKNLNKGEGYTPVASDYVDTYSSTTLVDPEDLELFLKYSSSKQIYSFFVVTKITNLSELPLYAYVPTVGANSYKAPSNSYTYKADSYKELLTRDSEVYIVFSIAIQNVGILINDSPFEFPIVITKDKDSIQDESGLIETNPHIKELEFVSSKEEKETVSISSEGTTVQTEIKSYQTSFDYALLNLDINSVPQGQDIQFTLFPFVSMAGQIMPGAATINEVMFAKTTYSTFDDIMANYGDVIQIYDASCELDYNTYAYNVSIPRSYLDADGTMPLVCGFVCNYGVRDQIQSMAQTNLLEVTVATSADISSSKVTKVTDWNESSYLLQKPITKNISVIEDTYYDDSSSITKLFTYKNYRLGNIPTDAQAIDLTISNQYADTVMILPGCKESVTVGSLLLAAQMDEVLNVRGFQNGTTTVNLPISLDENGCMEFCVVHIYKTGDVTTGQNISLTTNTQLTLITPPEVSDLFEYEMFLDTDYNPCYSINGLKDKTLKNVTIPNYFNGLAVRFLGNNAFKDNKTIEVVDFEENSQIEDLDGDIFSGCENLTTVNFHKCKNLKVLYGFSTCKNLTNMKLPDSLEEIKGVPDVNTPWYTNNVINGLYTTDSGVKYAIKLPTGATSFNFDKVKVIADNFARSASTFTTITNLNSVTNIGISAFQYCSSLTSVSIPAGATSIGYSAFYGCSSLTSVSIPAGVTSIGNSAFYGCSSLTSVTIPNSVTNIGYSLFYGCSSLTSITISNKVTSIPSYMFNDCSSLTNITIPDSVTSIGNSAFDGCSSLKSITIPQGVKNIPEYAFEGCSSLKSITIPNNVTSIGFGAFEYCSSLISITIPNSVTSIGDRAFQNCYNLTSITIPQGVTSIGNYSFIDCYKLVQIKDLRTTGASSSIFPSNTDREYITSGDFTNTLQTEGNYITYTTGTTKYLMVFIDDTVTVINDLNKYNITAVYQYAFYNNKTLTSITIPQGVTSISDSAFRYCSSLTSVIIPEGVTSIPIYAFDSCSSLTSITIPNSVKSIGKTAFQNCSSLTSIAIPEGVTNIGSFTFYACRNLTSVTIPNSVTKIENSAFYGCSSLTSVTIPNSVTSIGSSAFYDCKSLTSVTIPEGVTSIPYAAFSGCTNLTSVTIPEGVKSIGNSAFQSCSSLTSITIPNSVTSIGSYTFSGCTNLTSVTIPEGVTSIEQGAFRNCSRLTSITIPNSVTSIKYETFEGCSSLTTVNYAGSSQSNITINSKNEPLTNATWNYNYVG